MKPTIQAALCLVISMLANTLLTRADDSPLPALHPQPTPRSVVEEHLDALNHSDWGRIMAQYPENAEVHLPGGTVIKGRAAIGRLFAGFCQDAKDGGLRGIRFSIEHSFPIGDTLVVQWKGEAAFLTEPCRGSDAFVTRDGYMAAMVTTFEDAILKRKP